MSVVPSTVNSTVTVIGSLRHRRVARCLTADCQPENFGCLVDNANHKDKYQVLYHLVRVEPFTTLAIKLQGGKFDHSDLMFSNISATWNGVLKGMSDVKELVPNLFYLPEVLTNENSVDFGTTQLGEKLGILIKIFCTSIGWLWRVSMYMLIYMSGLTSYLDSQSGRASDLATKLVSEKGSLRRGCLSVTAALRHPYFLLGGDEVAAILSKLSLNKN
ncbi:hypothetical protein JHK82_047734 [Glycine max]|nr:hypothetical protein JHK82_047734 [Glycine max]